MPLDQANHTDMLSGGGCWPGWTALVAAGLLGAPASDHGHGTAAGATGHIQSWTGSLGTNTEHAHIPFSQEKPADTSQDIGTGDGSQLLGWGVPFAVCPAPVPSYKLATYYFIASCGFLLAAEVYCGLLLAVY